MEYHQTKTREKHKGKESMEAQSYQKTKDKMMIGNPHIEIITLNDNGLNSPVKRHRAADGIKKQPNYMLPPEDTSKLQRQK